MDERTAFIVVNVLANVLLLGRSYVTMQVLDYAELGLAALLQSIMLLVGTMQFGFLHGGFRLICSAQADEAERINNLLYTFFALLAVAASLMGAGFLLYLSQRGSGLVVFLGITGGVLMLVRSWMTSQLVANGSLRRLNGINMSSSLASVAVLVLIPVDPLAICLVAVVLQPVVFVAIALVAEPDLRPTALEWKGELVRLVLRSGFLVFLTTVFLQINQQVERWYVTGVLGLEGLGHLYLAILFVTLFQMIPTSLDQIFLPTVVRAHADGRDGMLSHTMRKFFLAMLAYCAVAAVALATFAEPFLTIALPTYAADLRYVYIIMPGLLLFTLVAPLGVIFNTLIQYRYYFIAYGAGTLLTVLGVAAALAFDERLDLSEISCLRSAAYALTGVIVALGFVRLSASRPAFRFRLFAAGRPRP